MLIRHDLEPKLYLLTDDQYPSVFKTEAGLFIAGVSSWQEDDEQGQYGLYGVWEYYARVSKYIDWISETTNLSY